MMTLILIGLAIAGLVGVAAALRYPRIALLALVVLDVANLNGVIDENTGFAPFKPELAIAVVATLVLARRGRLRIAWSPVHLGLLVLFAGFCLSFLNAADLPTGLDTLGDRGRGVLYYAIVFVLALSTREIAGVARAAVIALAALAALSVVQEYVFHNSTDFFGLSTVPLVQEGGALTPRHAGTDSDVNFWARLLILFVPFALSLTVTGRSRGRTLFWGGTALALILGVYLTQSRGGFIALLIAVIVWCAIMGPRSRRALLVLPVVLLAANPVLGFTDRLATLGGNAQSTAFADESVVTRERFQIDAWHMFLSSPVTGHGIGSYPALFSEYDRASDFFTPVTIAPAAHNFYLEQLADGGIVLMATWLFFFGTILFAAIRAFRSAGANGDRVYRGLAVGAIAGLGGWLVASVFLHVSDFRAVLLLAAVAALVDVRQRDRRGRAPASSIRRGAPSVWRRPVLAGVVIACLAGIPLVLAGTGDTWRVTTVLAVDRGPETRDGYSAYALDVVSRGHIPLTLAGIVAADVTAESVAPGSTDPAASVAVQQSRLGGAVELTVTAGSRAEAQRMGAAAATRATDSVAALDTGYVLTGSTGEPALVPSRRPLVAGALALAAAAAAVVALASPGRRRPGPMLLPIEETSTTPRSSQPRIPL